MEGEGPHLPRSLSCLWRWREHARGGKGSAQQGTEHLTSCAPGASPGPSQGHTGEGRRQGWRRSPLVGLRGTYGAGRERPQSFLHSFPGNEVSVRVCLNGSSSASLRMLRPERVQAAPGPCRGQWRLLEIHFSLHSSQS